MPSKPKKAKEEDSPKSLETQLWDAADKMRGSVPPSDYMHVSLGLVFLRYLSAAFERKHAELADVPHADPEDPEEYTADNIYWVAEDARWSTLAAAARSPDIGQRLDDAMRALERDNDSIKGVLPKIYGKPDFSAAMLGGLIDHFTNLNLKGSPEDFDLLGRVYEFFLGKFSAMQGKTGGEQYTPRGIVATMVEMVEPMQGRVYDPCCGTGGFFIQSESFIEAHSGKIGDIAIYGQERNVETYRLARMNLAIRGIGADIRWNNDGTFLKDAFPDLRFDYVLANPPFNIKAWSGELLRDDARWKYGVPPVGNANFAWIQHIYHHLSPRGYAAVVMANGSMSSGAGGEGEIRQALVDADAVDCMIAFPNQMFFGTQIPVCVWILASDKEGGAIKDRQLRDRRGETLFLDARKMGHMVSRVQKAFTDEDIQKLSDTYHNWREGRDYEDVAGFCKSASKDEIAGQGYVLTPGRYVGAEDIEDDGEPFEIKMPKLVAELNQQFEESAELETKIKVNLEGLGYGR
jgi:type I restriction enzyme M protein